jgi:hypothetical protein
MSTNKTTHEKTNTIRNLPFGSALNPGHAGDSGEQETEETRRRAREHKR